MTSHATAGSPAEARHAAKVARLAAALRAGNPGEPLSIKKRGVSHQVPKRGDLRRRDRTVDVSDFNEILAIDPEKRVAVAESGVTFVDLVAATLPHGLLPIVVPELKTITIGGAVAGCSIESTSFVYGGFHDTCLEYEVVTASGEVLTCRPNNEHSLVFQMQHGAFGTLGILSQLKLRLMPAAPYVHVTYERYRTLEDYLAAIWRRYQTRDVDFMDGIIHSPELYVLSLGRFVESAVYGMRQRGPVNRHRLVEQKLAELGGVKTLISHNYYTVDEFWSIWNRDSYDRVKAQTDPQNVFRDLYTRTCRTAMGLG